MAAKKELIMEWYRVFNWHSNPFEDEILEPIEDFIVGHEQIRQKINYFLIENHRFGTISAEAGNGKTFLLTWLRKQLEKHRNKVIADYFVGGDKDFIENVVWQLMSLREKAYVKSFVDSPLRKGMGFLRSKLRTSGHSLFDLFALIRQREYKADDMSKVLDFIKERAKKTHLVILIDDIEFLSKRNLMFLRMLLFHHFKIQIIVAGAASGIEKTGVKKFGEKDQLGIKLKPLDFDDFKELVSKRIAYYGGRGLYPFADDQLKKLYDKGNRNIKRALNLCADRAIKLALKQKKHEKAELITGQSFTAEKPESELEAFEKSADIDHIITSVGGKKKDDEYKINVIDREPPPYTIREKGTDRVYNLKEKKEKKHHKNKHHKR